MGTAARVIKGCRQSAAAHWAQRAPRASYALSTARARPVCCTASMCQHVLTGLSFVRAARVCYCQHPAIGHCRKVKRIGNDFHRELLERWHSRCCCAEPCQWQSTNQTPWQTLRIVSSSAVAVITVRRRCQFTSKFNKYIASSNKSNSPRVDCPMWSRATGTSNSLNRRCRARPISELTITKRTTASMRRTTASRYRRASGAKSVMSCGSSLIVSNEIGRHLTRRLRDRRPATGFGAWWFKVLPFTSDGDFTGGQTAADLFRVTPGQSKKSFNCNKNRRRFLLLNYRTTSCFVNEAPIIELFNFLYKTCVHLQIIAALSVDSSLLLSLSSNWCSIQLPNCQNVPLQSILLVVLYFFVFLITPVFVFSYRSEYFHYILI